MKTEPNNIENQFRDKLNNRTIKPSANSWDRLDAMLTVADPSFSELAKQKPKRNYRWMYFAASFLGFILIATVFLSQTEEVIDSKHEKVVFEEIQVQEKDTTLEEVLEIPSENKNIETVSTSEKTVVKQQSKTFEKPKATPFIEEKPSNQIAETTKKVNNSSPSIINQKTNVTVDADALLASVEQPKPSQSFSKNAVAIKVNSNELLSEIDDELELSFRERVLKSVNKKFQEVKVAVAKRNVE